MRLTGDTALATTGSRGRRIAASLALLSILLLAACGQTGRVTVTRTPTPTRAVHTFTPTPSATASGSPIPTVANSPFVCANPAGSSLTYAFVNADRQIYMVAGCSSPVLLTHLQFTDTYTLPNPVAWSPSHRYLAFHPNEQQDYCLKIVDTSTGAIVSTRYDCYNGDPSATGDSRTFIGWLDDNTFLGRVDSGVAYDPYPVRIVRVDSHSQAETTVASYTWMSQQKLRGNYLFYGGRVNPNDTNAFLYRLSLADGTSVKLVGLGLSGSGNCQMSIAPCSWTAPWDVSPDGAHILYHNPGASSQPSDTSTPTDTPVYYANVDGSGAIRVLSGQWGNLIAPQFDPTGVLATAFVPSANQQVDMIFQSATGGALQRVANSVYFEWRSDGQAAVIVTMTFNNQTASTATLLTMNTLARTPLATNTYNYLWA